jgi:hypothetical protein
MRHVVGIGVLIAVAFALRFWLLPSLAFDISIHDVYRIVPLRIICFWFVLGIACVCLFLMAWASLRRNSQ